MRNQPLFFVPQTSFEKTAGYRMPSDPGLWQSEVIKHLASSHPYLPLDQVEIDFRKIDPSKGAAIGAVIVGKKIAIPLIIQRPEPGGDPEMSPLDVFFHDGKYHFLDPETVKSLVMQPTIGEPAKAIDSRPPGGNPYIGDATGDANPMENVGGGRFTSKVASVDGWCDALIAELEKVGEALSKADRRSAITFSTAGTIGGGVRGVWDSLEDIARLQKGQRPSGKALISLVAKKSAKNAFKGGTVGAVSGVGANKALRRMGYDRTKLSPEAEAQVRRIVNSQVKTAGYADAPPIRDRVNPIDPVFNTSDDRNKHLAGRLLSGALDAAHPNDIARFRALVTENPDILLAARNNLGSFELATSARGRKKAVKPVSRLIGPRVTQVYADDSGRLVVKFAGRLPIPTDRESLRNMLGGNFERAMDVVDKGGVFMMTDEVVMSSWSLDRRSTELAPITKDGIWIVKKKDGTGESATVVTGVYGLDGNRMPVRMAITQDGRYAMNREMFGKLVSGTVRIPGGLPTAASGTGCFVHYISGHGSVTVPVRVHRTVKVDDNSGMRVFHIATDLLTGERCAVSPTKDVYGIMPVIHPEPATRVAVGNLPVYAIPLTSEWVPFKSTFSVADTGEEAVKVASLDGQLDITYGNRTYSMVGTFDKEAFAVGDKHAGLPAAPPMAEAVPIGRVRAFANRGISQVAGAAKNPKAFAQGASSIVKNHGIGKALKTYAPAAGVLGAVGLAGLGAFSGAKRLLAPGEKQAGLELELVEARWRDLDDANAREVLLAAGIPADDVQPILKMAQERGHESSVTINGLHAPMAILTEEQDRKEAAITPEYEAMVMALRPSIDMLKSAAESGHPDTVDSILSLEFITPQNTKYFIDSIEDFEDVASKLSALLIAVRLGLQHVPEPSVRDALEGLSKTVSRLKILKSASGGDKEAA